MSLPDGLTGHALGPALDPDPAAPVPVTTRPVGIELEIAPDDVKALLRWPGLVRTGRATPVRTLWYDTPSGALAAAGHALAEAGPTWRLEALRPGPEPWPPLAPTPVLAEAPSAAALGFAGRLTPVAGMDGLRRRFILDAEITLIVLDAELRGVADSARVGRILLEGERGAVCAAACRLPGPLRVTVPRGGLAAEAIAVARGETLPARSIGLPDIRHGTTLSDSIALVIGHLLDVMVHWSGPAAAGLDAVPVHQMRVTVRRLRSALSIFAPASACAELAAAEPALKHLAAQLGAARDWDVFLAGTGAAVAASLPGDRRIKALLAAAARSREQAYAALRVALAEPAFRVLQVQLGCAAALRPWETQDDSVALTLLDQNTAPFATAVLGRRWKRVRRAGRGWAGLDVPALHALRKDCKRLRYAAEFFRPLYAEKAGRRFVQHLAAVQDVLGVLNDGASACGLMAELGQAGRGFAAGVVRGFVAGSRAADQAQISRAWAKFSRQHPFWLK